MHYCINFYIADQPRSLATGEDAAANRLVGLVIIHVNGLIARIQRFGDKMSNFENPTWQTAASLKLSLYLHISAGNRSNYTKFSMRTQILSQAMET